MRELLDETVDGCYETLIVIHQKLFLLSFGSAFILGWLMDNRRLSHRNKSL
jgi:hypothetical protein